MDIVNAILLVLGILSIILFIIATIVIVYNKRMTVMGRMLWIVDILISPLVGPILVLIEALNRKETGDRLNNKKKK